VLIVEPGGDAFYRAFDAKRLAAADAGERLLLLEHACRNRCIAEGKTRREADHFLRAGRLAQAALHASIFSKAQQRPVGIIRQRTGPARGYARQAQRAALDIDLDGAEGRPGGERDDVGGRRGRAMGFPQRELQHVTFTADREETCGTRHGFSGVDRSYRFPQHVGDDRRL
jgi:hypothetical protein